MNRFIYSVFLLSLFLPLSAGDLIETDSDLSGLPKVLVFDCFPRPDASSEYFEPLDHRMRIPKNFEQSPDDPSWLNWKVRIVGKDGSTEFPFASIQFGKLDVGIEWIEQEFTLLSRAGENGIGADIYLRTPQQGDPARHHWLFVLTNERFLKVISIAEIDWNSLLTCFE